MGALGGAPLRDPVLAPAGPNTAHVHPGLVPGHMQHERRVVDHEIRGRDGERQVGTRTAVIGSDDEAWLGAEVPPREPAEDARVGVGLHDDLAVLGDRGAGRTRPVMTPTPEHQHRLPELPPRYGEASRANAAIEFPLVARTRHCPSAAATPAGGTLGGSGRVLVSASLIVERRPILERRSLDSSSVRSLADPRTRRSPPCKGRGTLLTDEGSHGRACWWQGLCVEAVHRTGGPLRCAGLCRGLPAPQRGRLGDRCAADQVRLLCQREARQRGRQRQADEGAG